jgi:hypothetical protein
VQPVERNLEGIVFYRAWLVLSPDRTVSAYPTLGAIAVSDQEVFRDPCSDKIFFGKMQSRETAAIKMPVASLSFSIADSAEILAIASGTDYKVHKGYRQRYLFQANVGQDGTGRLEPTQRLSARYTIDTKDNPKILCDNISLKIADEYQSGIDAAIAPDGTFQVNRSFYGKRMVCQMAVVLGDDVVVSTNCPLPSIKLNLIGIREEVPYYVTIEGCLPVVEAFDADAQSITLRLAFDNNNLAVNAVNLPTKN